MDEVVAAYLKWISKGELLVFRTDEEIVCGRVTLRVFPAVEADRVQRLVMDYPVDLEPEEAPYPMTLKSVLVGHENLGPLQARLLEGLRQRGWHQEDLCGWRLYFATGRVDCRRLASTPGTQPGRWHPRTVPPESFDP